MLYFYFSKAQAMRYYGSYCLIQAMLNQAFLVKQAFLNLTIREQREIRNDTSET